MGADEAGGATTAALLRSLGAQREHALGIVEGLTDAQLAESRLPSGWSCAGLLQHLALDVERYWFTCILGGTPLDDDDGEHTSAWTLDDATPPTAALDAYRREIAAADAVLATVDLDAPPRQRDPWWGSWDVPDARFVVLHVIAETACHAGHLDATRELLDGRQWLTL